MEKANKSSWFRMVLGMLLLKEKTDARTAERRAYHQVFMEGGNAEYRPPKHTVMSYAKQNRIAKKKRKARKV